MTPQIMEIFTSLLLVLSQLQFHLGILKTEAKTISFNDLPQVLQEISLCESGGKHEQGNKLIRSKTDDVGIMQISEKYHGKAAKSLGYDIYTAQGNMAYA